MIHQPAPRSYDPPRPARRFVNPCRLAALVAGITRLVLCHSLTAQDVYRVEGSGLRSTPDSTAAIQRALDTLGEHQLPIFLPGGNYVVSRPLMAPFRTGGHFYGVGGGPLQGSNSPLRGAVTSLVWNDHAGQPGQPLLSLQGTNFHVSDLTIARSSTGLLITRPDKRGLGTGKMQFDRLYFQECETGVQVGQSSGESNCDNLHFRDLTIRNCQSAYKVMNAQGMGHNIDGMLVRGAPIVFDVYGGGIFWVDGLTITGGGEVFRLRDTRGAIGSNNASYVVSNVKVDTQVGSKFRLVTMERAHPASLVFNGGHLSYDYYARDDARLAVIRGATSLTIRDWYNLQPGTLEWHATGRGTPNILIERCRLNGCNDVRDLLSQATSTGTCYFVARDCYRGSGEALADFAGRMPERE